MGQESTTVECAGEDTERITLFPGEGGLWRGLGGKGHLSIEPNVVQRVGVIPSLASWGSLLREECSASWGPLYQA